MKKLTKTQARDLETLRKMKDEDIDLSDIPEHYGLEQRGSRQFLPPGEAVPDDPAGCRRDRLV